MFTPARRQFLVDAIGEEKVQELEDETKAMADRLKALGIEFKGLGSGDIPVPAIALAFERFDSIIDQMMKQDKDIQWISDQLDEVKKSLDEYAEKSGWVQNVMGNDDGRVKCSIL